jgi:ATP-dependent 26S proteasome regulatory subunit
MLELIKSVFKAILEYFKSVWIKLLAQVIVFLSMTVLYFMATRLMPKKFRIPKYKFKQVIEKIEDFSDFAPNQLDTPIQIVTKSNGMFNRVLDYSFDQMDDPHWDFKCFIEEKRNGYTVIENGDFMSSYLPTVVPFAKSFAKIGSLGKNEYVISYVFEVKGKDIEIVVISNEENVVNQAASGNYKKASVSKSSFEEVFACAPDVDHYEIINVLFEKVSNKLHLTADSSGNLQISPVEQGYDQAEYVTDEALLSKIETEIEEFKKRGYQRTFIFYGPPGTGKSTASIALASRADGKVLKIDSSFIRQFNENKLLRQFFLKLNANLIVLDDVDHFMGSLEQSQTFLYILESMKTLEHKTALIMTVNDIGRLNAALLRPGRTDSIIEFKAPKIEERTEFIRRLLSEKFKVDLNEEHIERLAKSTSGMTQAYIKEWVRLYIVEGFDIDSVVETIKQRKGIMKKANIDIEEEEGLN